MKRLNIIFALLVCVLATSFAIGQKQTFANKADNKKGRQIRIFRQLGLSQEQIQQIRRINQETRPRRRQAALHLRETKKDLDAAIYADVLDEKNVQTRLKTFLVAQAEVVKLNRRNEIAVRNVLTLKQISKFRKLRRTHAKNQRKRQQMRRKRNGIRPQRRVRQNRGNRTRVPGVRRGNRN